MFSLALRPRLGRWLLLALMCLLPLQSLYAATAVQPAAAHHAVAETAQGHECHGDSGMAGKSQCDSIHCAACTPPIVFRHLPDLAIIAPVRVAVVSTPTLDITAAPALKPPRR
ncbi:hypothetical protein [Jeongeupia naejangsanensis]|uniref:DUF2946 domain-containing protein n=1 Tax=Jeongeupia naejangsanensis TaxID=613195 RepID=A0ABS2BIA7_9NEIS|nr:hypothetical protein [Jeongeupia naejangsanensis]MBM3115205.1 hypothetical protein [Jeongeupia naejangsanensis]